jgi:hypothetical protein
VCLHDDQNIFNVHFSQQQEVKNTRKENGILNDATDIN